jgi:hypothetical protein
MPYTSIPICLCSLFSHCWPDIPDDALASVEQEAEYYNIAPLVSAIDAKRKSSSPLPSSVPHPSPPHRDGADRSAQVKTTVANKPATKKDRRVDAVFFEAMASELKNMENIRIHEGYSALLNQVLTTCEISVFSAPEIEQCG